MLQVSKLEYEGGVSNVAVKAMMLELAISTGVRFKSLAIVIVNYVGMK